MSETDFQGQARQLLEILEELEPGKGYDLFQLGEHIGAQNPDELRKTALELRERGIIELVESPDAARTVVVLISTTDNADSVDPPKDEEKSIIVEASVGFMSSAESTPRESSTKSSSGRGVVKTTVTQPEPTPEAIPQGSGIEAVTIGQILNALAGAVENSPDITDREKWPLVEKIRSIASNQSILSWLSAPLKNLLDI